MSKWQEFSECRAKKYRKTVRVGLVAKDEEVRICTYRLTSFEGSGGLE